MSGTLKDAQRRGSARVRVSAVHAGTNVTTTAFGMSPACTC